MRCASRLVDAHTHTPDLFAKLPWPEESEMIIRCLSRCNQPPMSTTPRLNFHTVPLMLNVKQGSCEYQFLKSFAMARQGNEPRSTHCKEDALTTTPSLLPQHITAQSSVKLANRNAQISINKKNDRPKQ